MTDVSTMSDADLARAYEQSQQPAAGGPLRITVRPEGAKEPPQADPSGMSDEQLRAAYEKSQPSGWDTAYGLAKAGGVGVAKGAIGLAGLAGDVQGLMAKGGDWLGNKLLPEPSEEGKKAAAELSSRRALPSSETIQGLVEKVTGPFRKPQNQAEKDAETVGEFLPAALAGPGSVARKIVMQDAVPAAASIVAGRYSDQNPYVKALAGFLAGGAGAMLSGPGSVNQLVRSKLPEFVTEQHVTRAGQLIGYAEQRGVALSWPQALSRVTGRPVLQDSQRILESHPRTRAVMDDFYAHNAQNVENAARQEVPQLGGVHGSPSSLGSEAGQAAEEVLGRIRGAINQATRPSYDAARQSLVPANVHAAMMADPLFEQALNAVRNDPARNAMIRGLSDRSTVVYDAVKQELRERSQNAASFANPNASQTVASATGTMAGDVRNIAVAADRNAMGLAPRQGTGNLEHALNRQEQLREQILGPLQRGPLGKLADKDPTTAKAIEALFPTNPVPHSESEIRTAVRALVGQRPAVAEQLVRAHVEMALNEAATLLHGGGNQFVGARFAKEIAGNPQQRANLQAAIESLPNGAVRWQGFERMLDMMWATGQRQVKGSLTAFNDLEVAAMHSGGFQQAAATVASPGKWMKVADEAFKAWSGGRNLDGFARLITDPRATEAFRQIVRLPTGSDRAIVMAGRLITQLGAATTEQRSKSAQQ